MYKNKAIKKIEKSEKLLPEPMSEHADSLSLMNLTQVLESKLTPKQLHAIVEIGMAIGDVGLGLDDACLRSRVSKDELDNLILYVPEIKTYLHLKQVEFKYKLLQVVSKQATENGDVKIASWLLEKQYANEFDNSMKKDLAKRANDADGDVMEMAIAFIRRTNSTQMPVNQEAGALQIREGIKTYDMKDLLV